MFGLSKLQGRPIHPDLPHMHDWPHTISTVCALRQKYDSFQELLEVPPEEIWDFSFEIDKWIERLYPNSKKRTSLDIPVAEVDD